LAALIGTSKPKAAPMPASKAVQIALASIKKRETLTRWKDALKIALRKGNYTFTQLHSMVGKFEEAVKQSKDIEKAFVAIVEEYGNSDAQVELIAAKASFIKV
jgi:hypothetical protein